MKNTALHTVTIILMAIMFVITIIAVASVSKITKEKTIGISTDIHPEYIENNTIAYLTNELILSSVPEFACKDINDKDLLLTNIIHEPTFILALTEDFCSICVDSIINAYNEYRREDIPLIIIFNQIALRELHFRNEVFSKIECYSSLSDISKIGFSGQAILFVTDDLVIRNALLPFSGMHNKAYYSFFQNCINSII